MIRKGLHLDEKTISVSEMKAKRQNPSLKSYLEDLVIQEAKRLELPSKEYTSMMDAQINRFDKDEIEFSNIEEVVRRNGISN